jgi:hypothetical protein
MNLETFNAFSAQLQKEAAAVPLSFARGVGRFLSEAPAQTALISSLGGAAVGAAQNEDNRLGGALGGAWRGALAGGLAGGLGRTYRDARLLNPQLGGVRAVAKHVGGELADFGRRTIHGLTGAYNPAEIGMTSTRSALKEGDLLLRRAQDQLKHVTDPAERQQILDSAMASVRAAREAGLQGDKAIEMGVTSLPGTVKALASGKTRGDAAKYLGKQMIGGGGPAGVLMGVGLPLGFGTYDLMQGDESASGGRSIPQKLVNLGAGTATGAFMGGMPMGAQFAAGMGIDKFVMPKVLDVTKNITSRSAQPVASAPGEGPGRLPVT